MDERGASPLVEARELKVFFPVRTGFLRTTPLKAVDGVSFSIQRGETLGLVGESGCGKSTLGRALLLLHRLNSGELLYQGVPLKTRSDTAAFRKRASIVFQDPYSSLNPRMTAADIIAEPLEIHRVYPNRQERRERVLELMGQVGLHSGHAARYAHEFSGGQRQRIGIARALALDPDFVVCDEPVSALDVSVQAQVINMLGELQQALGLTYLFIAHDLLVVRHISDRVAVMYLGRLVELADTDTLYRRPLHPYTQALLSAVPPPDPRTARAARRIVLAGDLPSPLRIPSGCPFRTRCLYAAPRCMEEPPSLRELESRHYVACCRVEELN